MAEIWAAVLYPFVCPYRLAHEVFIQENSVLHEKWVKEYGSTIQYKGFFGVSFSGLEISKTKLKISKFRRLYTTDTKALNHVLMNTSVYQKPRAARHNLARILGEGVLVVEGEKHKQQNPAFGPSQIRELTEIFISKAIQLRDVWALENDQQGGQSRIDALSWLSRTTLDVIGLAGFNYKFDALSGDPKRNELNAAFAIMFKAGTRLSLIPIIRTYIPFLSFLKTEQDVKAIEAKKTMMRISHDLLRESKNSVDEKGEKRDLLTLLVNSNMATDIPEHQRMSDQDVLAQIPTFLVAGHETTRYSGSVFFTDKDVQNKLRQELLMIDTDNPTMEQLNALPYLDMVVRETLRVHCPVPSTIRIAVKDDVLPLGHPITDRKGVVHTSIKVTKGQMLFVPILAINRDKAIWGEDAAEFRPERWEHVPEAAANVPGVWGNMLTFLGGPRACIGYRFSLVETKALLFTLIRAFEFDLAVPAKDIIKKSSVVQRPVLTTDPEGNNQMPLLVRPVVRS
ncbi:hypothetical protein C0993_011983 [Termitomyces sp. T159_Od127]|nr:hypothetical protein C0993_011983 [Termitomyces sp. T159_Od127]